ncbi:MAG: type I-U CRISPR-associated protein Csx17, partial [Planctomycetia bacterium]|nr:type I-U CRISPR-associated protein Csx17 [Planctomycetia bacterium]
MPEIPMPGCTPEPLMSYLKALGVFRLVAEQADPDARLSWRGGIAVLHTSLHRDRLERFFLEEYRPTPISSPWNGGSGFYRTWDSKALRFRSREAVDHVSFVQQSTSERLLPYREALSHVQAALNQYARPIDVRSMPEKERKATLLLDESSGILDADQPGLLPYLRATLPDESVCWLDTALLLQTEDTRAAPLFISGGNDGNFDFSVTFIGSLRKVFAEPKRSVGWLKSSVFADGGEPLDAGTAGHFNPAGLGGPNGGQGFVGTGGVNPWDFVFMMEGAVMMAGAVSRRFGTQTGDRSSFPFCVSPVAIGFGSADKSDESSDSCRTELWLPQWSNASTLAELRYLFAEGRAQFGRGQARNAVQFALATCMLGVNRGIDSFVRFSFLRRFGKMFLAVPLGRIPVTPRPTRQLLDDPQLVNWIDRLRLACRDNDKTPARFQAALRDIDQTIFAFANRSAPGGDAKYLLDVLRAVGRAERTFATEGLSWLKDKTYGWKVRPLFGLLSQWLDQLVDQGAEFRLAASLAGIRPSRDGAVRSLRAFLEPVEVTKYVNWSPGSTTAVWSHRPLAANLAAVFRRRQMEAFRAGESGVPLDSLRWARLEDVLAFLNEQTDDEVLADLIWGLIAVKPDAQEP